MSQDYDFDVDRWVEIFDSLDEIKESNQQIQSNSEPPRS